VAGAVIGWFGTVLGALALILALATVPSTWADHHHGVFLLLVAAVIACLAISVILPGQYGLRWAWFRWKVWRASKRPHFAIDGKPVMVDIVASPHSADAPRDFQFVTNRLPRRQFRTPGRPVGLRITAPVEADVWASQLPRAVGRYGRTIFRVHEFLADGFVITDQASGFTVQGEVAYDALIPMPPAVSGPPEAQAPPEPAT